MKLQWPEPFALRPQVGDLAYQMSSSGSSPVPEGANARRACWDVVGVVSTGAIFRGVTAFWVADIFRLALIVLLPILVLYIPTQMGALGH